MDLDAVEGLASGLETLFSRVREGTLPLDQQATRVIHQVLDASEDCVGAFRENRIPEEPAAALRAIAGPARNPEAAGGSKPADLPAEGAPAAAPAPAAGLAALVEMVRLPAENLDRLVRSTGQILTESLRQASVTGELDALDGQIAEMADGMRPVSQGLGRALVAPGELSRSIRPVVRHIGFVEQKVRSLAAQSRTARLLQQRSAWNTRRSAEQLQRDVWSARMAPAEDLFEGFRKMVRDLAREENKEIDFRLSGSGVRADRIVLQALKDPVMHLLRNAISHGIETPGGAREQGKIAGGFTDPASGFPKRTPDRGGGRRWPGSRPEEGGQACSPQAEPGAHSAGRVGASHLSAGLFHFRHRQPPVRAGHGTLGGLRNGAPPPGRREL